MKLPLILFSMVSFAFGQEPNPASVDLLNHYRLLVQEGMILRCELRTSLEAGIAPPKVFGSYKVVGYLIDNPTKQVDLPYTESETVDACRQVMRDVISTDSGVKFCGRYPKHVDKISNLDRYRPEYVYSGGHEYFVVTVIPSEGRLGVPPRSSISLKSLQKERFDSYEECKAHI